MRSRSNAVVSFKAKKQAPRDTTYNRIPAGGGVMLRVSDVNFELSLDSRVCVCSKDEFRDVIGTGRFFAVPTAFNTRRIAYELAERHPTV